MFMHMRRRSTWPFVTRGSAVAVSSVVSILLNKLPQRRSHTELPLRLFFRLNKPQHPTLQHLSRGTTRFLIFEANVRAALAFSR